MTGRETPPVLEPAEYEPVPVAQLVAELILFDTGPPLFPAVNAGAHPSVFQEFFAPAFLIGSGGRNRLSATSVGTNAGIGSR